MALSKEQKEKYIDDEGRHCPFCESKTISCGEPTVEVTTIFQNVVCYTCKKEWTDGFTITNVEEMNAPS